MLQWNLYLLEGFSFLTTTYYPLILFSYPSSATAPRIFGNIITNSDYSCINNCTQVRNHANQMGLFIPKLHHNNLHATMRTYNALHLFYIHILHVIMQ